MNEMKKCPHCGAIQNPSRQTCIDCGRVLPEAEPKHADELRRMASEVTDGQLGYYAKGSFLYYFTRSCSVIGGILLIFDIILLLIFGDSHNVSWLLFAAAAALFVVVYAFLPAILDRYHRENYFGFNRSYEYTHERRTVALVFGLVLFLILSIALTVYFLIEMPGVDAPGLNITLEPYRGYFRRRHRFGIRIG